MSETARRLVWIGPSEKGYLRCPAAVQAAFFERLNLARAGVREISGAKPLAQGILKGRGVVELIVDFDRDSYRLAYTTKLPGVLAVLHVFKKKSKSGIDTPLHEARLIRNRYREAVRLYGKRERRRGRYE
ncbi:MAG TPA: type II toxin-antitoxin system RelE/ParE family toxin [Longimicrobiaceae bacterium]|nr:type II toxin-antitoxin system RelE/ParE family toxin [Longimicrobiaceae bacterium]